MYDPNRKIRCEVVVNDQPLEEYQTEVDGSNVTCWIVAEEGKKYEVRVTNERHRCTGRNALSSGLYIDGHKKPVTGKRLSYRKTATMTGQRIDKRSKKPFLFGRLVTSAANEDSSSEQNISLLSSIQVKVWKVKETGRTIKSKIRRPNIGTTVNEKAATKNKGLCNSATVNQTITLSVNARLGDPVPARLRSKRKPIVEGFQDDPYVTFTFKYRSCETLEALEIIPLTTAHNQAPGPLNAPPQEASDAMITDSSGSTGSQQIQSSQAQSLYLAAQTLSQDERADLIARLKDEDKGTVKREVDDGVEVVHVRKRPKFSKADNLVVDLTGDD
ncbi:hypothetical protein HK097_002736 [Rhizophlyctis rosea]|uniref:DUF7918 domain-containing protein n=1 Tax=Rhizophlyctis rosea TaxID=64517 RepID=A0AAD5S357_9FUNG|nr:hypothetical protein HK097_002736 [Rhizophlyctis rosea]